MGYKSFTQGDAAPVVTHVPITGGETDIVVAFPGDSATGVGTDSLLLDLDTAAFVTDGNYTGTHDVIDCSTTQLHATTYAGAKAHQVPVATPVSFGGMFYVTTGTEATPYLITSSQTFNNINYAAMLQSGLLKYQTSGGLYSTGVLAPTNAWFHYFITSVANRTTTIAYLNGTQIWTDTTVAGTADAADEFYIGNCNAASGDLVGRASDVAVFDVVKTPAQVRTIAENAFGHLLP